MKFLQRYDSFSHIQEINERSKWFLTYTLKTFVTLSKNAREFDTLKSKIFDRVRSELFFLSNLISIFVVYISKYCKYETCN